MELVASTAPGAITERVDRIFAKWNRDDTPGCALGVVRDGELVHEAYYGMADLEHGVPHSPLSVFDIASTSKQFTATAVVLLDQLGELSLDDDVRAYVPEIPDYGTPITLRHLIHHTSGLRDYINLRLLAGVHDGDYVDMQDVIDILARQRGLNFPPGTDHMYSNSGYTLLAVVVGRVTGRFFGDWCQDNIFKPLGMTSTRFRADVSVVVPGLVQMYAPLEGGEPRKTADNEDVVGDGGLLSTVQDLARWERNFIDERVGGAGFRERMATPGTPENVEERYAFGLSVGEHRGRRTVSHGGNLRGFSGEFLRFPEQRLAVICLANVGAFDASGLALRVADLFLEGADTAPTSVFAAPQAATTTASNQGEDAAALLGAYRDGRSGVVIDVARDGDNVVALLGGMQLTLLPAAPREFTALYQDTPIAVIFDADGDGAAEVRFVYNGHSVLSGSRIEPPVLGEGDLEAYAGVFHSDELAVDADVAVAAGQLFLRRGAAVRQPLRPSLPDEFAAPFAGVRFTRDDNGTVDGFELSMARSAAVGFRRRPVHAPQSGAADCAPGQAAAAGGASD